MTNFRVVILLVLLVPLASCAVKTVAPVTVDVPVSATTEVPKTTCGQGGPLCYDGLKDSIDANLDSFGKHWGEASKFSGYILVTKDGSPIYSRGMGYMDRENKIPNTPDTNFRIGSVTKQFTAAAILSLQEAGKLKITDTIDKYLPEYPKENASRITIHHLLTHTSGTPSYTDRPDIEELSRKALSPSELIALSWDKPLDFEPGAQFKYSNSGYAVLGAIVEAVSKMSYGEYLQKNLFDKAGLSRTTFGDAVGLEGRALGYKVADDESIKPDDPVDMSVPYSAGGIRSTANDLALWDKALKDGTILSPESIDQLYKTEKEDYACGWNVTNVNGHTLISHGGGINGFVTQYLRLVDDGVAIVVWTNVPNAALEIGRIIKQHLLGEPYEQHEETPIAPLSKEEVETLTGGYVITDEGREILVKMNLPAELLEGLSAARVEVGDSWLAITDLSLISFRAYTSDEPHMYFTKRDNRLEFLYEGEATTATGMRFYLWGQNVLYKRDDAAAEKLFKTKLEAK